MCDPERAIVHRLPFDPMNPYPNPRQRWLILRNGAVGDTILLSPLIQMIRHAHPRAWIEVMGVLERVSLLTGAKMADQAISSEFPGMETLYSPGPEIHPFLADYFGSFDVILAFTHLDSQRLHTKLSPYPHILIRTHPPLPHREKQQHCIDHYVEILHDLLELNPIPIPKVTLAQNEIDEAHDFLRKQAISDSRIFLLVLHAGAGGITKQVPLSIFVNAARAYHKAMPTVCLIPKGPSDEMAVQSLQKNLPHEIKSIVLDHLPLRKLAALIHCSDTFIGNDSGITHLAAAVGCPTLVLFKETDPNLWSPRGPHVRCYRVERFSKFCSLSARE